MKKKLRELFQAMENHPEVTCPAHGTHQSCAECPYTISDSACNHTERKIDYLLSQGVIVPPCPIGTTIYMLVTKRPKAGFPEFTFVKETKLKYSNLEKVIAQFGKTVFLFPEEANTKLNEIKNISKKSDA